MIVIIDNNLGNLGSILNMFKHIGVPAMLSADHDMIMNADKLVLPGVGSFDSGMKALSDAALLPVLNKVVLEGKKTVLGICLGMQMMGTGSEEGIMPGLGWLGFKNNRFDFSTPQEHKLPHMGWNWVKACKESPLLYGLEENMRFYFVHSYHAQCEDPGIALLETVYGYPFVSAVQKDNIYGVQFHPEKSHTFGMQLLKNFAERC